MRVQLNNEIMPVERNFPRFGKQVSAAAICLFLVVACASNPPPTPKVEMQAAEQAISTAEQGRVAENSPLEMKEAREKLTQANNAIQHEDMVVARRLAEQSRLMAELAVARSEALKAKQANEEIEENIETLKEEMQRSNGGQL